MQKPTTPPAPHKPAGSYEKLNALRATWTQKASGNHGGKRRETKFLVIHYTAGEGAQSAINWLRSPASKASAHLVIDQQGQVTQLVDLECTAWHAGESAWGGERSLNLCSIGIELVNPGPLARMRRGVWGSVGRTYEEPDVVHAPALHGGPERAWAKYPDVQIAALLGVSKALHAVCNFQDIVGHDQIAIPAGRKQDPGPAFPMVWFRGAVLS